MKPLLVFLLFWFLLFGNPVPCYAQSTEDLADSLLDESGLSEVLEDLPPETADLLEELELEDAGVDAILALSFPELLQVLWRSMQASLAKQTIPWTAAVGAVLFAALGKQAAQLTTVSSAMRSYQTVTVLVLAGALVRPLADYSEQALETAKQLQSFLSGFIPVFAAAAAASGQPTNALLSQSMLLGLSECFALLVPQLFLPLLSAYLAVVFCAGAGSGLSVQGLTGGIRSVMTWGLGVLLTLYSAVLAMKGFAAQASDSFALRTGKYLAGSLIPVVGKTISDTTSAFLGALGLVRNVIGVFGIVVMLLLVLPTVLSLIWSMLCLKLAGILAETFSLGELQTILSGGNFILSMYAAILSTYGLMVLLSLALLLSTGAVV
jgi:stage III sporulation protein AE